MILGEEELQLRTIKLTVAYEGTAYHGFQRQSNAVSIQQVLEDKLAKLFGHELKMAGSGRTDAGVHAYGQVVSFKTSGKIPAGNIPYASRSLLPYDIVVTKAEEVADDFHAQFSARSKIYVYRIYSHPVPNPFLRNQVWMIQKELDVPAMQQAMQAIIGTHDFSAFRASGGTTTSPVRTIMTAQCEVQGPILELSFWGNGFLYHMVRNFTGTLMDIGLGKLAAADMKRILEGRDRTKAGITAPAQGLYLKEVFY